MRTSSSADLFKQLDAADSDHDQLDHEQIAEFFASIRSGSLQGLVRSRPELAMQQTPIIIEANACACAQFFAFLLIARAMDFAGAQLRLNIDANYIKWMMTTYRNSRALKCYERFLYDQ